MATGVSGSGTREAGVTEHLICTSTPQQCHWQCPQTASTPTPHTPATSDYTKEQGHHTCFEVQSKSVEQRRLQQHGLAICQQTAIFGIQKCLLGIRTDVRTKQFAKASRSRGVALQELSAFFPVSRCPTRHPRRQALPKIPFVLTRIPRQKIGM